MPLTLAAEGAEPHSSLALNEAGGSVVQMGAV